MTLRILLLTLSLCALPGVSCQRIPPSVSIPGYDEKNAPGERAEGHKLGTSEKPPEFFSGMGVE